MNGASLLLATMLLSVDYGWQASEQGGLEYIIQIEPELVQSLLEGREVISEVMPEVQGVRRFRIRVGDGEVPREPAVAQLRQQLEQDLSQDAPANGDQQGPEQLEPAEAAAPANQQQNAAQDNTTQETQQPDPPAPDSPQPERTGADEPPQIREDAAELSPAPERLRPDPAGEPLEHQQVGYLQGEELQEDPEASSVESPSDTLVPPNDAPAESVEQEQAARRWWPFTLALVALFTSLGGNAYLGWLAASFYQRYRSLAERVGAGEEPAVD